MINTSITVSEEARAFLVLQKGNLWHLKDDREEWLEGYNRSMANTYGTIAPYLPEKCEALLDVGSGLGGIDIMINRHYGGGVHVELIDGVKDVPVLTSHIKTFNSMEVAERFHRENGGKYFDYCDPEAARDVKLWHTGSNAPLKKDLIISFGAWCFHFPPSMYLPYVRACCKPGTVLILDVRYDKIEWYEELVAAFGQGKIIRAARKFNKYQFINNG